MATWKTYTAQRMEKHAHQNACSGCLSAWRQRLVVQRWRRGAAEAARLNRSCTLLLHRLCGQTQSLVLLSWRVSAQAQAKERYASSPETDMPFRTLPDQ